MYTHISITEVGGNRGKIKSIFLIIFDNFYRVLDKGGPNPGPAPGVRGGADPGPGPDPGVREEGVF